jgi:hypothetical protein
MSHDRETYRYEEVVRRLREVRRAIARVHERLDAGMPWALASESLPPAGADVLTYGCDAPDGPWRVRIEHLLDWDDGVPCWSRSDAVTHWCRLADVPPPEGS